MRLAAALGLERAQSLGLLKSFAAPDTWCLPLTAYRETEY